VRHASGSCEDKSRARWCLHRGTRSRTRGCSFSVIRRRAGPMSGRPPASDGPHDGYRRVPSIVVAGDRGTTWVQRTTRRVARRRPRGRPAVLAQPGGPARVHRVVLRDQRGRQPGPLRRGRRRSVTVRRDHRAGRRDELDLNAVVAQELPGPGSVFLQLDLRFLAPVRPGDVITGAVEVTGVGPATSPTRPSDPGPIPCRVLTSANAR
jgi:hypothetical protein